MSQLHPEPVWISMRNSGRKEVVVVRSGIGKVNAGMCTQILADVFGVEAVINTGIAGSLNNVCKYWGY